MGKINVLSFAVANLIAAGEVVDRPSSVIKELIENSVDSGADRITVEIMRGGISFMRVSDNGCGMTPEDLPVAVKRHATSKIRTAADLDGITTLGFRGEALAAICAVADVRIISKVRGSEMGAIYEISCGRDGELSERGASDGTTVIVENLFANVPARLKFLKKDTTEALSVGSVVEKEALAHPEIAFSYISDGVVKLETSGNGELSSAVRSVFGKVYSDGMLNVDDEREGVRVKGFICSPMQVRPNRNYENFFINGRYVKSKTAMAALEQAYKSYIPPEKFPGCVLDIEIAPNAVDVNVHPSKLEVKFSNERPVFDAIYFAVRRALTENERRPELGFDPNDHMPSVSFTPQRASDAFVPVRNGGGSGEQLEINSKTDDVDITKKTEEKAVVPDYVPPSEYIKKFDPSTAAEKPYLNGTRPPENIREYAEYLAYRGDNIEIGIDDETTGFEGYVSPGIDYVEPEIVRQMFGEDDAKKDAEGKNAASSLNIGESASENADSTSDDNVIKETVALDDAGAPCVSEKPTAHEELPCIDYRIVGELFNSYIIVEKGDTSLIIDKHAAHERLNFERFKARLEATDRAVVMLAVPRDVMLMSGEVAAIEEYRQEIEKTGFDFTTSRNAVSLTAIPEGLELDEAVMMIESFAGDLADASGNIELTHKLIFEKALYQASCKASIKAGRVYPPEYINYVVGELMKHPDITYCPHGRPVAFEMKKSALDHRFKRT